MVESAPLSRCLTDGSDSTVSSGDWRLLSLGLKLLSSFQKSFVCTSCVLGETGRVCEQRRTEQAFNCPMQENSSPRVSRGDSERVSSLEIHGQFRDNPRGRLRSPS